MKFIGSHSFLFGGIVILLIVLIGGLYLTKKQTTAIPVTNSNNAPSIILSITPASNETSPKEMTTYTACGCGCCGGTIPNKKCLYHSKGERMESIAQRDVQIRQSSQCAVMGCSGGIEYHYCD